MKVLEVGGAVDITTVLEPGGAPEILGLRGL